MAYKPQNELAKEFMEKIVIPALEDRDLDYYKLISTAMSDFNIKSKVIEDLLDNFIKADKIKELRILTIPDRKLQDSIKKDNIKEKDLSPEETEKLLQEAKEGGRKCQE